MGESTHDGLTIPGRVVLAREPSFTIGAVRFMPGIRQARTQERSETLEPRVLQVLVVLARAHGEIVTRDELIELCWGGRIVSDDAINRVLSRIRRVATGIGGGSFAIETIPRVGYRLRDGVAEATSGTASPDAAQARHPFRRRTLLKGGMATVAIAGTVGMAIRQSWRHHPPPEAEQLYRRGMLLSREGLPGQVRQSVAYFERATAIDPGYADAWGALALSYSHLLQGFDQAEFGSLPQRIRSAAARAVELDPANADAQLALIFMTPYFHNWRSKESQLREVIYNHPRHWLAHGRLAVLLYQVGRLNDGIAQHRIALKIEPMLPTAYFFLIQNLSALGRAQEAEACIEQARQQWPAHPAIWVATFNHLLFSGRPKSAQAFAMNPDALPSSFGPKQVNEALTVARALGGHQRDDIDACIEEQRRNALDDPNAIPAAAEIFAALGRADLVFSTIERYLLNRGPFGSPMKLAANPERRTDFLFSLPMRAVRADPAFAALVRDAGLETYWQQTRSVPDYRRS